MYKLKTYIRRKIVSKLGLHRPSSYPYISGDTFRALSQHTFDESIDMNPAKVREGDIVFVRNDYLKGFFETRHPHITEPYILISHNDDAVVDQSYEKYIDEKIIHWFGLNVVYTHDKITPLPLGIENICHNKNGITADYDALRRKPIQNKAHRILFGFSIKSDPIERSSAFEALKKNPLGEHINEPDQKKYYARIQESAFVASPPGRGPDCHRTWEALYLGSTPLVRPGVAIDYFKSIGLPLYIVNDWNKLDNLPEKQNIDHEALWMPYWIQKIESYRHHE